MLVSDQKKKYWDIYLSPLLRKYGVFMLSDDDLGEISGLKWERYFIDVWVH